MSHNTKLVMFDLDGTLVDSSEDVVVCFNFALEEEGLSPADPMAIKSTIGYSLKGAFSEYGDPNRLYDHFIKKARKTMGNNTILLPGAFEALSQIHDMGLKIAIATTKIRPHALRILKKLGIDRFIGELSCADDVKEVKPDPEALTRLLDIYGVDSRQAIMVGDTINDVIAARNAGMRVAALTNGFDPVDKIKGENPDWILDDIRKVVDLIKDERKA
ncbi:MAG: HAD-IA family hydrolase [candidate division Zixibacteria bacterium]|nr:HAD-IA family hydrolase [candidate division Zixibacteria bacterium]